MKVLSICTGMGLMDKAFIDSGFDIVPGCEVDADMGKMYQVLCGRHHIQGDIEFMIGAVFGQHFDGIIGGPPCQAHTKLRSMRSPKFRDLTPEVNRLLNSVSYNWFLFENVKPVEIPGAKSVRLNAMHFYQPHQSRSRWFTYSPNIEPPPPVYSGSVDDLMAYSVVAGRIYGPKRGAKLQGYPAIADMQFPCVTLQKGLANAVPYPLALAWADSIKAHFN